MTNLDWIVVGSLVVALIFVGAASIHGRLTGKSLMTAVGPVNFDFTKSFASTITAVGAILTTIVAAKNIVLTAHPHLDTASYAALSIFFGVLVVIAPFVYRSLSTTRDIKNGTVAADIQYQGSVLSFLLATLVTVWAVVGQMVTLLLFLMDIEASRLFVGVLVRGLRGEHAAGRSLRLGLRARSHAHPH